MKKKNVLMLLPYCILWVFLTLYADYTWGIAWQYGLVLAILAVGAGILSEDGKLLMLGNLLSLGISLVMVLTAVSAVMQMLVWKKQHDSKR